MARELADQEVASDLRSAELMAGIKEEASRHPVRYYDQEFEQYVQALGQIGETVAPFLDRQVTDWQGGDKDECAASRVVGEAVAKAYGVPVFYDDPAAIIAYATGAHMRDVQGVQGFYCSDPESIVINQALGPEAKTFALWHEIGHLMLGHQLKGAMPSTDIGDPNNPLHGVRSFEYMADAFAMTMLQRTGVHENRFCRVSSVMTMFRFERQYEAATNPDFDDTMEMASLSDFMTHLDIDAAIKRKQEFLRANWTLLIDKADEVREALAGDGPIKRQASPANIPPGQQSTPEERQQVLRQRFHRQHQKEIEDALGTTDGGQGAVSTTAAPESPSRRPASSRQPAAPGSAAAQKAPVAAPAAAIPPTPPAAASVGATREERMKAIEEAATALGRKMQGAFGHGGGTMGLPSGGSRREAPGSQEAEEEINDWLSDPGL